MTNEGLSEGSEMWDRFYPLFLSPSFSFLVLPLAILPFPFHRLPSLSSSSSPFPFPLNRLTTSDRLFSKVALVEVARILVDCFIRPLHLEREYHTRKSRYSSLCPLESSRNMSRVRLKILRTGTPYITKHRQTPSPFKCWENYILFYLDWNGERRKKSIYIETDVQKKVVVFS